MRVYANLLRAEKFNVEEASDSENALEILRNRDIDIMLLDINMPGVNGVDLLKMIRSNMVRELKVIVSSVYPVYEQELVIPDADGYFDKSQSLDMLIKKISRILEPQNRKAV